MLHSLMRVNGMMRNEEKRENAYWTVLLVLGLEPARVGRCQGWYATGDNVTGGPGNVTTPSWSGLVTTNSHNQIPSSTLESR